MLGQKDRIREKTIIRIIGTDPSTTHMGNAVIDVNITETQKFQLRYVNTVIGDKVDFYEKLNYTERPVTKRTLGMSRSYKDLLEIFEPDIAICEDNFLGASADTYKRLVETVSMLRDTVKEHSKSLFFMSVLPNLDKAIVGANFKGTQKEDVLKGLKNYPHLDLNGIDLDTLDDHSVDSIVIALYLCEMVAKDYKVFPHD